MNELSKINLLGIEFTTASEDKILEYIITSLKNNTKKYYIVTPNPELIVLASNDIKYKEILNNANLALPDGIGVVIASKLLGKPIKTRITGVDFMKNLCRHVSDLPVMVSFLGAGPSVAENTADCLRKMYPNLKIAWAAEEFSDNIKTQNTDILFVAFGSPKQEIWISENLDKIPAKVIMGVGGAFDLISGKIPRAPKILQNLGLEWLFRLFIQPWRIKRQVSLLYFIVMTIKEKFGNYYKG